MSQGPVQTKNSMPEHAIWSRTRERRARYSLPGNGAVFETSIRERPRGAFEDGRAPHRRLVAYYIARHSAFRRDSSMPPFHLDKSRMAAPFSGHCPAGVSPRTGSDSSTWRPQHSRCHGILSSNCIPAALQITEIGLILAENLEAAAACADEKVEIAAYAFQTSANAQAGIRSRKPGSSRRASR